MGRPLTTLRRYSGIWSAVSGVPWARRRTARSGMGRLRTEFADHAGNGLHVFDRGARHDAMPEIEDVPGATTRRAQNLFDSLVENFQRGEQRDGVEIALHGMSVAHSAPSFVERLTPVKADHIGAGRSHITQKSGGLDSEVDDRHA